jgi:hypothetical protein
MSDGERKRRKARQPGPPEESLSAERLVAVWNAPDETTATAVRDFLVGQGIEAAVVTAQIAWFGSIEAPQRGWGNVEVLESHAERARRLIQDFFEGRPQKDADDASRPKGERG